tara:strand:+ start:243 stop:413 length:171 start_codon:yes stop_codon:yes gene_type:complete
MIESFFGSLLAKFFYDSVKDNFKNNNNNQIVIEKQVKESEYINWIYEAERKAKWQK